MQIEIGHRAGIDATETEDHGLLYTNVDGERTTTITIPDGTSVSEAMLSVKDALAYHIQSGGEAVWVRSDNKELENWIATQLGVGSNTRRPANWGQQGEPA